MTQYALHNIKETNTRNTAMFDYLNGLGERIQDFVDNKYKPHIQNIHDDTAELTLVKIANHVTFSILDLETGDVISGYAVKIIQPRLTEF